ncbi:MAG: hypothetical protein QXG57_05985 [Thermofilaceae archaeon]
MSSVEEEFLEVLERLIRKILAEEFDAIWSEIEDLKSRVAWLEQSK